ncbi:MAG: DtxR family transcriptional regulator, Mn-dependent transcriptional regulator [Methanofollis sp.]|nr:DtxR family transcriptional regulator, Mn-dependent transcriptional regulator [Methanofollis sp.]
MGYMNTSVREDCLEAILTLTQANGGSVTAEGIMAAVDANQAAVEAGLAGLVAEGAVRLENGEYLLSPEGKTVAESVLRKHRVLECFLCEMLGMDTGAASKEACVLEHGISDDTIDRLSRYIERPGHGQRRHCAGRCRERSLLDFAEGDLIEITMIRCLGRNRRLIDLGLIPGEQIVIRRKLHNNAIVVRVKGADIALSPEIASTVFAEPVR